MRPVRLVILCVRGAAVSRPAAAGCAAAAAAAGPSARAASAAAVAAAVPRWLARRSFATAPPPHTATLPGDSSFAVGDSLVIPGSLPIDPISASRKIRADITLGAKPDDAKAEVKDAKLIFDLSWSEVLARVGIEGMVFPREIVWLSGAPGAGKGTMAGFILKERDIQQIFEVSSLLQTAEMKKLKEAGQLIGDGQVVSAVLVELMKPKYANGVVVDGFPRTTIQAEFIKLLYDKLQELWETSRTNPRLRHVMRRPQFSICVLYVDESESVRRQLKRGKELAKVNQMVAETGVGLQHEMRATDLSEEAARRRYKAFKDEVYTALQVVKDKFHFHFIPADGGTEEVRKRILTEFAYQSGLDLQEETFEMVRQVETASSLIRGGRSNMVTRLNSYASDHRTLFEQAITLINAEFMHIIRRQALAGSAIIRSNNPLFENGVVVNIVLDVLAERGFTVTLDVVRHHIPAYVEPQIPGDSAGARIVSRVERSYIFRIDFPRPEIRRAE